MSRKDKLCIPILLLIDNIGYKKGVVPVDGSVRVSAEGVVYGLARSRMKPIEHKTGSARRDTPLLGIEARKLCLHIIEENLCRKCKILAENPQLLLILGTFQMLQDVCTLSEQRFEIEHLIVEGFTDNLPICAADIQRNTVKHNAIVLAIVANKIVDNGLNDSSFHNAKN